MKKTILCLVAFVSFWTAGYAQTKVHDINLDHVFLWDQSKSSYKNNVLTIENAWNGAAIWLEESDKKAAVNNYLSVDYNASSYFCLALVYKDESKDELVCWPSETNINLKVRKDIKEILLQSYADNLSVTLNKVCFTNKGVDKSTAKIVDNNSPKQLNSDISAKDFAKKMKVGWNLGNTLDACPDSQNLRTEEWNRLAQYSEINWNEIYTTKEIIHFPRTQGYSTVRIPVTWFNHIIDDKYTIDPRWMARVKQVVDWAIEDGYYVILNEHHSVRGKMNAPIKYGEGYIPRNTPEDIAESERFLKAIWKQIAEAFNNSYDEHLIFETMNEPRNTGHEHDQWQAALKSDGQNTVKCNECREDYKIVNRYNQICLDTIRASGGNNANRFVMIPTLVTSDETPMHELFELPEDSAKDKLMVTVHNYIWLWQQGKNPKFSNEMKTRITKIYSDLNKKFISKGIPVVIGETGADKWIDLQERIKWISFYAKLASGYGIPMVQWDGGGDDGVSQYDRVNLKFHHPEFIKALLDNWKCD